MADTMKTKHEIFQQSTPWLVLIVKSIGEILYFYLGFDFFKAIKILATLKGFGVYRVISLVLMNEENYIEKRSKILLSS